MPLTHSLLEWLATLWPKLPMNTTVAIHPSKLQTLTLAILAHPRVLLFNSTRIEGKDLIIKIPPMVHMKRDSRLVQTGSTVYLSTESWARSTLKDTPNDWITYLWITSSSSQVSTDRIQSILLIQNFTTMKNLRIEFSNAAIINKLNLISNLQDLLK